MFTDGVSVDAPGFVSSQRIKKLTNDLKQCVYMEASASTGENVDIIFQSGEILAHFILRPVFADVSRPFQVLVIGGSDP